jgi:hypothetical protein
MKQINQWANKQVEKNQFIIKNKKNKISCKEK